MRRPHRDGTLFLYFSFLSRFIILERGLKLLDPSNPLASAPSAGLTGSFALSSSVQNLRLEPMSGFSLLPARPSLHPWRYPLGLGLCPPTWQLGAAFAGPVFYLIFRATPLGTGHLWAPLLRCVRPVQDTSFLHL